MNAGRVAWLGRFFGGLLLLSAVAAARSAVAADAERLAVPSVDVVRAFCHQIAAASVSPEARAHASRYLELTAAREWRYTVGGKPRTYTGAFARETQQDGKTLVWFTSRAYVPLESLDAADQSVVAEIRRLTPAARADYATLAASPGFQPALPSSAVNEFSAENNRRAEEARRLQFSRGVPMPVPNPLGVTTPAATQTTVYWPGVPPTAAPPGGAVPPPPVASTTLIPPPPVPAPPPNAVVPGAAGPADAAPGRLPAPPGAPPDAMPAGPAGAVPPPPPANPPMPLSGPASMAPPVASQTVVSGNLLSPVTVFFDNTQKDELIIRLAGPRDPNQRIELRIPPGGSVARQLERFAGAQISQTAVLPGPGGTLIQQNRQYVAPSAARYTAAVYQNRVQYRYNAAPNSPPGALPSFDARGAASLGVFTLPADERLVDGQHFDVYRLARLANNPGAAVWSGLPE